MRKKEFLKIILLFIICFNFFYAIQANAPSIIGADGFYHIKVADMMKTEGVIEEFPWMQHSIMNEYADLMFLYHVLLVPFTFFSLEFGAKLSAVVFGSLLICSAYWLLKRLKVKHALLWSLLLLGSAGFFLFRLSLPKAVSLSILFSFIGLYFIIKKKHKSLLILSFLYAWLYTFAPVLLFFSLINSAIIFVRRKKIEWKLPLFCFLGLLIGFVINPYFPRNIYLWYVQTIKIALFPVTGLSIGVEWSAYSFSTFVSYFFVAIIMFMIGTLLMLFSKRIKNSKTKDSTILLFIISAVFFLLALKSRRYGEYFVPFVWLFFVLTFADMKNLYKKITSNRIFLPAAIAGVVLLLAFSFIDVGANIRGESISLDVYRYQDCAEWLSENSAEGDIVLSQWDAFPPLFMFNSKNYYVNGLDLSFLYFYDPILYENYVDVFSGRSTDISAFNASYVVAKKKLEGLETVFSTDFCHVLKPRP